MGRPNKGIGSVGVKSDTHTNNDNKAKDGSKSSK